MQGAKQKVSNRTVLRGLAMFLFGIVLPLVIATRADTRVDLAQKAISSATGNSYIMEVFEKTPEKFKNGNDYAIVALADSERANLAIMINKQIMKMVIIYMGFAVMSFAIMFIVLGFTDEPLAVGGDGAGIKLDFKFGSIGAAVFVMGAAMAAGGGLLPNEYRTVGLPGFLAFTTSTSSSGVKDVNTLLDACKGAAAETDRFDCMENAIAGLRKERETNNVQADK